MGGLNMGLGDTPNSWSQHSLGGMLKAPFAFKQGAIEGWEPLKSLKQKLWYSTPKMNILLAHFGLNIKLLPRCPY